MAHVAQNNRTHTYRFTMDPTNPDDMALLKALRTSLKGTGQRVKCQGRGFKNDQIRQAYKLKTLKYPWSSVYQIIYLNDAKNWDVYVYDRS